MKLHEAAAIALAGLALSLAAAPAAEAARSEFFGIANGPSVDETDLNTMAATGARSDRFLISWKQIEATRGQRNWGPIDHVVGGFASHGIRGAPFVWGSPHWARTGGGARPPVQSVPARQAWEEFLKAAVARYGPGGSYWANGYRQQFGQGAPVLPIRSWQIWNEPNLRPEFYPGATPAQAAHRYADLLEISHDAIKSRDRRAEIVLAGIATQNDTHAFDFLDGLYSVPGIKDDFDAVAQHPYASSINKVRGAIQHVRSVMASHGDQKTPLWITEFGWGSAPPDGSGINLGLSGQATMLTRSLNLILDHRSAWNLQRVFWFHWRDPSPNSVYVQRCIRCGSAGLLTVARVPKPAFAAYLAFAAETVPPVGSIVGGPKQGGRVTDATPSFSFASSEPGSTFACRIGGGSFAPCTSPYTTPRLSDGPHTVSVRAIDAAGNESDIVSRSFTIDTRAPAPPAIGATFPGSPANANAPRVRGSAESGSTVRLYRAPGCTGSAIAKGPAARFASSGLVATVPDNSTTSLRATATDTVGHTSPCSGARTYVEDSRAPQTTITAGPSGSTTETSPTFNFTSSEAGSSFACSIDLEPFRACSGPGASDTPSAPLSAGAHSFRVRAADAALNTDLTPAARGFAIVP